jgi:hypothetical protein
MGGDNMKIHKRLIWLIVGCLSATGLIVSVLTGVLPAADATTAVKPAGPALVAHINTQSSVSVDPGQEFDVTVGCSAWPGTTPTGGGYEAPGGTSWMIRVSAPVTDAATNQVVGWRVAGVNTGASSPMTEYVVCSNIQ